MKYSTALKFYKTGTAIARVLGVSHQAVYPWEKKDLVPFGRAVVLEEDSKGKCKVDKKLYVARNRHSAAHAAR